jgi:hypothetical protein
MVGYGCYVFCVGIAIVRESDRTVMDLNVRDDRVDCIGLSMRLSLCATGSG